MQISLNRFPGGRHRALTMSYDDGRVFDRELVGIFDRYGIRGTFHLNSGFLGHSGFVSASEVATLFSRHEVSVHTLTHPDMTVIPDESVVRQIVEDRRNLEDLAGYPVRGMSYPYGTHSDRLIGMLPTLGMEYARTIRSNQRFAIPDDFLRWDPTCHHKGDLTALGESFLASSGHQGTAGR